MKRSRPFLFLVLCTNAVFAQTTLTGKRLPTPQAKENVLFYLQRTKNTNTVMYEARPDAHTGRLSADRPVDAYWLHYELNNGKRAELSSFEQMAVYGVDIEELKDGKGSYLMRLKAFKKRAVTVAKDRMGRYVGLMDINGRKAVLKRIYIEAKEGLITPTVVHVDLFGSDPLTGDSVFERIIP
jgi:hypothetical protein